MSAAESSDCRVLKQCPVPPFESRRNPLQPTAAARVIVAYRMQQRSS